MSRILNVFMCLSVAAARSVVDLSGHSWTLENLPMNISVPGRLPSQATLDLYAANVIGDPNYSSNAWSLRWIVQQNWSYVSEPLHVTNSSLASATFLLFEGLDTFTTIKLCDQFVAYTDNQFRQYYFDVSHILRNCTKGEAKLDLNFGSAPDIVDHIANEPGQQHWPEGVEINYEFPNKQWMRKQQSDFASNTIPAYSPAGPWKPAYLIQLGQNEVFVRNSDFDLYRKGQMNNLPPDQSAPWVLNASLDLLGTVPSGAQMTYLIFDNDSNDTMSTGPLTNVNVTSGGRTATGTVTLENCRFDLWWPAGMGSQKLYNVTIELQDSSQNVLASTTHRMGFRTIVMNQTPISSQQLQQGIGNGSNWHFEINGQEFYAKGSNFVPPDAFWPRVDYGSIRNLFSMAINSNQNLIRVWGAGAYGPDFMYDLADEMGMLLWSEFALSDALYPTNASFLENLAAEASYQVRRLNHHPSVAVWVGGNEAETVDLFSALAAALRSLEKDAKSAIDELLTLKQQYETVFLDTLIPSVFENSRSISYMASSTNAGYETLDFSLSPPIVERYQAYAGAGQLVPYLVSAGFSLEEAQMIAYFPATTNETSSNYADTDYYNYTTYTFFDTSIYPRGRFAVEFGQYSYPSIQTWSEVLPDENLRFEDPILLRRVLQSNPTNLAQIPDYDFLNLTAARESVAELTRAIEMYYPVPDLQDPLANFSAWCQTTQVFQAELHSAEIQFYRWGTSQPWRTLGSLYWQLNDGWQTSSWAGIEHSGRWKYVQYVTRDIYQHVIVSPFYDLETGQLNVSVTSDLWSPVSGTAQLTWYNWSGNQLKPSAFVPFTVGAINSTMILDMTLNSTGLNLTNAVLHMNITAVGSVPNSAAKTTFMHENFLNPVPLGHAALIDPGLELTHSSDQQSFGVVATKGIAAWTWLDYPAGSTVVFDANAFFLLPGVQKDIGYTVYETDGTDWQEQVTIRSIWNNTLNE